MTCDQPKAIETLSRLIQPHQPKFQLGQIVRSKEEGDCGVVHGISVCRGEDDTYSGCVYSVVFPIHLERRVRLLWVQETFLETDIELMEVEA